MTPPLPDALKFVFDPARPERVALAPAEIEPTKDGVFALFHFLEDTPQFSYSNSFAKWNALLVELSRRNHPECPEGCKLDNADYTTADWQLAIDIMKGIA